MRAALVYGNTLMLQDVIADDPWVDLLTPVDQRGLTPLMPGMNGLPRPV